MAKRVCSWIGSGLALGILLAPLGASAAEIQSVKNESANFRDGPGDKHAIVYSADKFYPVEVLEKKDGWAKVKDFEGDVAWVAERLLAKQETVVVEGDRVNVREKPNTTSEITFKAERGEVFKVESHQGKWLKVVDANGDGGWVRDDMVWGEKVAAAEAPKGKTKGEIEDPTAKGAIPPAGDKPLDKPTAGNKPKSDKGEAKPKEGKPGAKPAAGAEEKAKAGGAKGDDKPKGKAEEKAEEKADEKSDEPAQADDAKAEEKSDDAKADEKSDAKPEEKSDAKSDDDAG